MPPVEKRKKNINYSLLDSRGIIRKRINGNSVYVDKGDVIIGKTLTKSNKNGDEELFDCSFVIKSGEEGFVDRVIETIASNGYKLIKVVIRNNRIPEIGDKMACYTDEHEVLTENGWKFVNKITLEDKIACLIDGKVLEYHKPTEVQSYDYKGNMYNVESDKVSLCVTPNHRMYTGNCHRKNYKIQRADEIYGKMRSYKNNVEEWVPENCLKTFILPGYGDLPDLELDLEAWCIFFGIWISEGTCSIAKYENETIHSRKVNIAVNKDRVQDQLGKCMDKLKLKWNMHMTKGESVYWYCGDVRLIYYLHPLSVGAVNKYLPEWCFNLDINHSRKLIEGMMLGDGDYMKETTTERYYTSSIRLRDDFHKLCLHAGWGCNYYLKSAKGILGGNIEGRQIVSTTDHWNLTICKTQNNPLVNKYIKTGKQLDSWLDFDGKVYCCTVPTKDGLIYVRRNGKGIWSGNSRSAQKGTIGLVMAQEDLPFTQDGIVPDIILNPLAIPSRMTLNVLLETVLGKSCLIDGSFGDATPFTSSSANIVEKLCDKLEKNGFDRFGWETMYSGFTGEPIDAKIFTGPTYYCRLKHMVKDKIHCLSIDTEVLTKSGWKTYLQLTKEDLIATLKDNKLVYESPIDLMFYPDYEGSMYSITTNDIDLQVTGNHRMWVCDNNSDTFNFERSDKLVGKPVKYKRSVSIYEQEDKKEFELPNRYNSNVTIFNRVFNINKKISMSSWLIFLGNFYRSGQIDRNNFIVICITEAVEKSQIISSISDLTDKFSIFSYCTYVKEDFIAIYDERFITYIKQNMYVNENKIIPDWIMELSKNNSDKFARSMLLNKDFITDSKVVADRLQQISLHGGYSSVITEEGSIFTIRLCQTDIYIDNNNIYNEKLIEKVKCPVFCLQVPSEVFYVRRNGKACWTGNSRASGHVTTLTRQPLEGNVKLIMLVNRKNKNEFILLLFL